jgi:hypothetical protein
MFPDDILNDPQFSDSLANMSARPRTSVSREIRPIRQTWVSFTWTGIKPRLTKERLSSLDMVWRDTGFTGCALLQPVSEAVRKLSPHVCRDSDIILNVLLRSRSGILISTSPLLEDTSILRGLSLASDDPRLCALVVSGSNWRTR